MQKYPKVEGLIRKYKKGEGVLGINALLLPPSRDQNRGGVPWAPAALGRRPWSSAAASGRGKGAGRHWRPIPLLNSRGGGPQWRRHGSQRRPAAGVRGGGAAGTQWRPGLGENGEESDMNPIPTLVRAGAQRGEELRGGRLRVCDGGAVAMLQLREGGVWGSVRSGRWTWSSEAG